MCEDKFVEVHDSATVVESERDENGNIVHMVVEDEYGDVFFEGSATEWVEQSGLDFEWSCELHPDGSFDADPCPKCGEDKIFNVHVEHGAQMVGTARRSLDEQKGDMHMDDQYDFEVTWVKCGNCHEILLDE